LQTIAYKQFKLPEHSKESIWLLTNATQKSKVFTAFFCREKNTTCKIQTNEQKD